MKYFLIILLIASFYACKKKDNPAPQPVSPIDSPKLPTVFRYIGIMKAKGFYWGSNNYYDLDTTLVDTFYITPDPADTAIWVKRNYFSPEASDGVFHCYTYDVMVHLATDSTYYYHRQHFIDNSRLFSHPDSIYWNHYDASGGNGNVTSVFTGSRR